MNDPSVTRQMPCYQSHKKVWALKLKRVEVYPGPENTSGMESAALFPEDESYAPIKVDADYVLRHKPQAGGYYVVYSNDYVSWSPAQAFEEGYTLIT